MVALQTGSADCALLVTLAPGSYIALVSGGGGETGVAMLEISEIDQWRSMAVAPTILGQPQSLNVNQGQSAAFNAVAVGLPTPTYQWKLNGVDIAGATGSTLNITDAQPSMAGNYTVVATNASGSVTSSTAALTVNPEVTPAIVTQPISETTNAGVIATFWTLATGTPPLSYQWFFNGTAIAGATSAIYAVPNTELSSAGAYTVTVSNFAGKVTSSVATLTVNASGTGTAPVITQQPSSQTIASGGTVAFSTTVSGSANSTYQWFWNDTAISGATDSLCTLSDSTSADNGSYTCLVMNAAGSIMSAPATLNVVQTSEPGRLINISCRASVGANANILIAGFVVGGSGNYGQESVLVRASGPALIPLGVSGTLPDPQLQLYQSNSNGTSTLLGTNDGWAGNTLVSSTATSVGAFAWTVATSHDSALVQTLSPGPYTAQIAGASGDTGVALAEVYDATPANAYTLASPRLINLSARVQVGTGGNVLIAGFVIGGSTSKTVLIRASGPALKPFGVTGTLPDPELQLYHSNSNGTSTLLGTNTGWGGDVQIATEAASVGAFSWGTSATSDSALLVTLPPGAYTAQVSGASGDTGIALVEVYEVP